MTFTEAAAQVLRLVGKPLHYKEITDVAIEKNLLSHVGKSPEVTMGARLAALVKKGEKDNPLVRIKPGVFALREWDQDTIQKGLADRTPALERLAASEVDFEGEETAAPDAAETSSPQAAHVPLTEEEETPRRDEDELERAELAAHATELFESEEDDDEPIFGGAEESVEAVSDRAADSGGGRGRRRRRRGRGRGGDERGDDLPSYTVSDAPAELPPDLTQEIEARVSEREGRAAISEREVRVHEREPREPREAREPREPREVREPREGREPREPREAREPREGREPREPREPRESRDFRDRERADRGGQLGDLTGRDLADTVEAILASFDRNRGPVACQTIIDAASRRGRFSGEHSLGQNLVLAAARADNLRCSLRGVRPRFRINGTRIALTEWQLESDLVRLERELVNLSERYREAARRALVQRFQDLPHRSLGELVTLLLEHMGFTDLTPVRRPGSHGAELHLCGKARGPAGEVRTAIVVRRDGREVGRERVTELRGALHHYGPAASGLIVTTGQVLSGAREEANAPLAAPVTVIDGASLAKLCEEHGIGVVPVRINLPLPDLELFESLR